MRNDKRRERHKKMTELYLDAVLLYLQERWIYSGNGLLTGHFNHFHTFW